MESTQPSGQTHYRVVKYSMPLSDAQQKKTAIHTEVNDQFFHRLFGIRAGLPRLVW